MSLAPRRLAAIAAVTLAALAPLACDDDPSSSRGLAARYTMTSVNGAALPAVRSADPAEDTVASGEITVLASDRMRRSITLGQAGGGGRYTFVDTVRYGVRGFSVWMVQPMAPSDTMFGTILNGGFEWTRSSGSGSVRYSYTAQP